MQQRYQATPITYMQYSRTSVIYLVGQREQGDLECSGACLSQTCWVGDPDTPVALLRVLVLPEVPAPRSPRAPRVPPRSPASLYDACVLMSGVRDARVDAYMREYQKSHVMMHR